MSDAGMRPFRDIRGLAGWTPRLLALQATLAAAAVAVALLHGPGFDDEGSSTPYAIIALLQALTFLAAAVAVLRWTYLANSNAHALGAQALSSGPGLAVGWYFIPIANLGMPLRSLRETWKASIRPLDWETVKAPAIFGWWWLCWLLGNFASTASFRLGMTGRIDGARRAAELLTAVGDAFHIPASLLLATIIARATAQLQARREEQVFS